jgi:pyruvate,orthophosphate dikinase
VEVLDSQTVKIGAKTFREGDYLSINGSTGNVY